MMENSISMISNEDIWKGDKSHDDSKHFIENYQSLNEKKTKTLKNNLANKITFGLDGRKEEDYNDDVDESIIVQKSQQITQLKNIDTNINNLNEISLKTNKFSTSPDDILDYRSTYQYSNFSFTPQSQLNINEEISYNKSNFFPSIPNNYFETAQNL
jgi:hypothetical protein